MVKRLGKRSSQKEVSKDTASQKSVAEVGSVISPETTPSVTEPVSPASNKRPRSVRNLIPKTKKQIMLVGLILVLFVVTVGVAVVLWNKNRPDTASKIAKEQALTNKYVRENNTTEALKHAKQALASAPDDLDAILVVASLSEKTNPKEAKQYYAQALEVFKKIDNPDIDGKKAGTYWGAAGMADKAGLTDQAKKYYQKVIDTANLSDGSEWVLAKQSKEALQRLK